MKIERFLCDICLRAGQPWTGVQYFTEEKEIEHVKAAHKWVQKCVDTPDGESIVLRYLHNAEEFNELLLLANNAPTREAIPQVKSQFEEAGWYFLDEIDGKCWEVQHITYLNAIENVQCETLESQLKDARHMSIAMAEFVIRQNDLETH